MKKIVSPSLTDVATVTVADLGFSPGGAPTPKVGVLTHFFGRKLHENERIWTPRGVRIPGGPLRSATELSLHQKQGSSGRIQLGHTIKSCDFFLNPMQQMQQILILSHSILLLFTFYKYTNI